MGLCDLGEMRGLALLSMKLGRHRELSSQAEAQSPTVPTAPSEQQQGHCSCPQLSRPPASLGSNQVLFCGDCSYVTPQPQPLRQHKREPAQTSTCPCRRSRLVLFLRTRLSEDLLLMNNSNRWSASVLKRLFLSLYHILLSNKDKWNRRMQSVPVLLTFSLLLQDGLFSVTCARIFLLWHSWVMHCFPYVSDKEFQL